MAADERLRCWSLGVRVRESTESLIRNAREMEHAMPMREREQRRALLQTQVDNLRVLVEQSSRCGTDATGVAGDLTRLMRMLGSDPMKVSRYADDFALTVHNAASESVAGLPPVPPQGQPLAATDREMRSAIATAMPGKYPFIDAESFWESLDPGSRLVFLDRQGLGYPMEERGDIASRPFGALDKDFQDVLEGLAAAGRLHL